MFERKVLYRKAKKLLYEAVAHLTDVFSMLTFSPLLRFLYIVIFGRELLNWDACVTLSVLRAQQQCASVPHTSTAEAKES